MSFPRFSPDELLASSDWHLNHGQDKGEPVRGIIKHSKRPFVSAREMDEAIISKINAKVPVDATLVFGGDLCWYDRKRDHGRISYEDLACEYRKRIKCRNIFFVWGNHDKKLRTSQKFKAMWRGTYDYLNIQVGNQHVVFSHYAQKVWEGSMHDHWNIYGHSHGNLSEGLTKEELEKAKYMKMILESDRDDAIGLNKSWSERYDPNHKRDSNLVDIDLFDRMVEMLMPKFQTDCGIDAHPSFDVFSWAEIEAKMTGRERSKVPPDICFGSTSESRRFVSQQ